MRVKELNSERRVKKSEHRLKLKLTEYKKKVYNYIYRLYRTGIYIEFEFIPR